MWSTVHSPPAIGSLFIAQMTFTCGLSEYNGIVKTNTTNSVPLSSRSKATYIPCVIFNHIGLYGHCMLTTCMDGIVPVAVPPILEKITSATSTGLGSRLRTSDSLNVQNEEAHFYV